MNIKMYAPLSKPELMRGFSKSLYTGNCNDGLLYWKALFDQYLIGDNVSHYMLSKWYDIFEPVVVSECMMINVYAMGNVDLKRYPKTNHFIMCMFSLFLFETNSTLRSFGFNTESESCITSICKIAKNIDYKFSDDTLKIILDNILPFHEFKLINCNFDSLNVFFRCIDYSGIFDYLLEHLPHMIDLNIDRSTIKRWFVDKSNPYVTLDDRYILHKELIRKTNYLKLTNEH